MRRALEYVKAFDGVVAQHAQEPRLTEDAQMNEGELSGVLGLRGWPAVAEEAIIARDVLLAAARRLAPARLPRLHRRLGRDHPLGQGARASTSPPRSPRTTCSSPTTWCASYDPISRSTRRCAPRDDVEALRAALADGTIDAVATDHAPHPHEDKDCEWAAAAIGMLGLETALSASSTAAMVETGLLDWARRRRPHVRAAGAHRPAGRPGPPLAVGRAGEPRARRPARRAAPSTPTALASQSRNTPYAGMELPGAGRAHAVRAARPTVLDGALA